MYFERNVCIQHDVSIFWAWCFSICWLIMTWILHNKHSVFVLLEHRKVFYFCDTILLTLEFALWTPVIKQSRHPEENDKAISDNFLLVKSLDTIWKDFYRWHVCNYHLCMCIIHFVMVRSNVLTAHTQAPSCSVATHVLKNLSWQIMSASHHNMTCTAGE